MPAAYRLLKTTLLTLLAVGVAQMSVSAQHTKVNDDFVKRDGTRLTLGGQTFRYAGANIEWLGLIDNGPFGPLGARYPSHFEVDDVLDTATPE
jgi:hypothetical protein